MNGWSFWQQLNHADGMRDDAVMLKSLISFSIVFSKTSIWIRVLLSRYNWTAGSQHLEFQVFHEILHHSVTTLFRNDSGYILWMGRRVRVLCGQLFFLIIELFLINSTLLQISVEILYLSCLGVEFQVYHKIIVAVSMRSIRLAVKGSFILERKQHFSLIFGTA